MSDRTAAIVLQLRDLASPEVQRLAARFRDLIQETKAAGASQEEAERKALSHAQALARLAQASGQGARGEQVLVAALAAVNAESTAATRAETALLNVQARAVREAQQLADSEIRVARATGDHTRALQLIRTQLDQTSSGTARYNTLLAQQALAQREATPGPTALAQGLDAVKSGLLNVIGPAAIATAAFAAVGSAAQGLRDGLELKTQLDGTNAAIAIQVRQLRDYGQVQREGQAFADAYKLTQQDLASTLQAAIPVFRQSNASTTETLQTFLLLQRTAPEKPISEAARAIRELATGDVTSIKELFNVPAKDALAMKEAIQQGQDPVKVVADYLKRAGADAELLRIGTTGAAGAMKDAARAAEELQLAQGQLATSAGATNFITTYTAGVRGLARILNGDILPSQDELIVKSRVFADGFNRSLANGGTALSGFGAGYLAIADSSRVAAEAQDYFGERAAAASRAADLQRTQEYMQGVLNLKAAQEAGALTIDEYQAQVAQLAEKYQAASVQTQQGTNAFGAYAAAAQDASNRLAAYNAVARDTITLSADDIVKKQQQQLETDRLSKFNDDLRAAAVRVAAGQASQAAEASALAAKYPELGSRIGEIINREAQLAGVIDLANQKLREQQLLAQKNATVDLTNGRGVALNAPGRGAGQTNQQVLDTVLAAGQRQKDAEDARKRQIQALESTAERVARLRREEAAAAKGTAEQIDLTTARIQAERQLAQEQEAAAKKGAKASASRVSAAQSTALQYETLSRSSAEEIERIQRDSLQRLQDMQEDFDVRRSRGAEDFERRKRRLLAEGKVFEARQAQEEFDREQRRAQEDLDRARARQQREVADRLGDQGNKVDLRQDTIAARAAIRGTSAGTVPSALPARPPTLQPATAPQGAAAQATRPMVVELDFAPIQLIVDGQVLADVSYPHIEARLTGDLTRVSIAAPPQTGVGSGTAGPRP